MKRLLIVLLGLAIIGFGTSRGIDWWNFNVNTRSVRRANPSPFHVDPGRRRRRSGRTVHTGPDPQHRRVRHVHAADEHRTQVPGRLFCAQHQHVDGADHRRASTRKTDQKVVTFPEGFPLREQAKVVEAKKSRPRTNNSRREGSSLVDDLQIPAADQRGAEAPFRGYLFPRHVSHRPRRAGVRGLIRAQLDQFRRRLSSDVRAQIAQATPAGPPRRFRTS